MGYYRKDKDTRSVELSNLIAFRDVLKPRPEGNLGWESSSQCKQVLVLASGYLFVPVSGCQLVLVNGCQLVLASGSSCELVLVSSCELVLVSGCRCKLFIPKIRSWSHSVAVAVS